jgi:DNA-binding GntR family transcriptional regulator
MTSTMIYRTKRDVALGLMREAIMSGELAPGTRLILEDLSRRFGLSLTPIREALPVLETEGFVVQLPHKGAIVAPMDREEILELYATRGGMEAMVTRQAVPKLTDEAIAEMAELIRQMEDSEHDWDRFLTHDKAFHVVLYQAAGSRRWLETIETLWHRSTRYMIASTAMSGAVPAIHADHRALLSACEARDADRAADITRSHLEHSRDRLLREWT